MTAVPYSLGKKIVLDLEQSKAVVRLLTDQSGKLYQFDGEKYVKKMPNRFNKNKS